MLKPDPVAVVVVPVHSPVMTAYERISFQQCLRVLNSHHIVLIHPQSIKIDDYRTLGGSFETRPIADEWFTNLSAYNRLKCSSYFYSLFPGYDFLLTYELDSFVFSDALNEWCRKNYDFIGAPWFEGFYNCTPDSPIVGVGNSGFSLRNLHKCWNLLICVETLQALLKVAGWEPGARSLPQRLVRKILKRVPAWHALLRLTEYPDDEPEDAFWCMMVNQAFKDFHVAPVEEAIHFSFEANSNVLYKRCGNQLPFGAHAWHKVDQVFWRPWIESFGYELPQ